MPEREIKVLNHDVFSTFDNPSFFLDHLGTLSPEGSKFLGRAMRMVLTDERQSESTIHPVPLWEEAMFFSWFERYFPFSDWAPGGRLYREPYPPKQARFRENPSMTELAAEMFQQDFEIREPPRTEHERTQSRRREESTLERPCPPDCSPQAMVALQEAMIKHMDEAIKRQEEVVSPPKKGEEQPVLEGEQGEKKDEPKKKGKLGTKARKRRARRAAQAGIAGGGDGPLVLSEEGARASGDVLHESPKEEGARGKRDPGPKPGIHEPSRRVCDSGPAVNGPPQVEPGPSGKPVENLREGLGATVSGDPSASSPDPRA